MRTQKADLLLMNVDFLDENWERVRGRDIVIRDGVIVEIRKHGDSETVYEANETVDGGEMLYLPGFIDSHMHTGQQLLRGRVLDAMPMIWKRIMLPFESTLNEEDAFERRACGIGYDPERDVRFHRRRKLFYG
ncbi:MAG: hypothetical protein ACLUUO_08345 [Sellimonas intestinalis]